MAEKTLKQKIRILVIDDSDVIRLLLKAIFEHEDDMEIVGVAVNGADGVQKARELKPDIITMDIRMPVMNGFEATRAILKEQSIPILVVSSSIDDEDVNVAFKALEVGALGVIEKPKIVTEMNIRSIGRNLVEAVRNIAGLGGYIKVPRLIKSAVKNIAFKLPSKYKIIGLGCSTGGPPVLQTILASLPANFPIPIVVVQHMATGFMSGLVNWLQGYCALKLKTAEEGEELKGGVVYFPPDDEHLLVKKDLSLLKAHFSANPSKVSFRPSIDVLFDSIATACPKKAIGGLLTGMGKDGANGLLAMRQHGCSTFIQDKKSCIIYGMPYYALSHGAVEKIVPLADIAAYLLELI
jgi:two-component system, chemotaxis family, protein-glutamate methylesterase/glutaminase